MRSLFIMASLFLLASCGNNSVDIGNRTTAEYDPIYNAGKAAKGEIIKAKIKIKNTGDYPLVVGDVQVSCSCTLASKPEEPINPGSEGFVETTIDTDKVGVGKFSRDIRIIANTTPTPLVVSIQGEVIK